MIFKEEFKVQLKDIGKNNFIKNRAILEIFENIATHHSDSIGYGPNDNSKTGVSWVLLDWKLEVIKRPIYGDTLKVHTWGRVMKKAYTYRDFEVYDENNNLCIIGTSKWVLVSVETGKLVRINEDILRKYQFEDKSVFEEYELSKLQAPNLYERVFKYNVCRRDIDLNGHMHNLYYLDLAYEALPDEIYEKRPYNSVRIQYKKEVKLNDLIECRYHFEDGKHIVNICSENGETVNAIIVLE